MLTLKKVAVTGGLASGKSSVCRVLRNLGAYVVSADEIVHRLLSPETTIGKKVIDLIGKDIIKHGTIDRGVIAERVFNQPSLLKSLEQILHPAVGATIKNEYEQAIKEGKSKLFVAEIPLLFESQNLNSLPYDKTIVVLSDDAVCKKRYEQSGHNAQDYERRMKQQMPTIEKAKLADYVIHNNGSEEELKAETTKLFTTIINL